MSAASGDPLKSIKQTGRINKNLGGVQQPGAMTFSSKKVTTADPSEAVQGASEETTNDVSTLPPLEEDVPPLEAVQPEDEDVPPLEAVQPEDEDVPPQQSDGNPMVFPNLMAILGKSGLSKSDQAAIFRFGSTIEGLQELAAAANHYYSKLKKALKQSEESARALREKIAKAQEDETAFAYKMDEAAKAQKELAREMGCLVAQLAARAEQTEILTDEHRNELKANKNILQRMRVKMLSDAQEVMTVQKKTVYLQSSLSNGNEVALMSSDHEQSNLAKEQALEAALKDSATKTEQLEKKEEENKKMMDEHAKALEKKEEESTALGNKLLAKNKKLAKAKEVIMQHFVEDEE